MNTVMTHRQYPAKASTSRAFGWAAVVALHALIGWTLVTGTARKGFELIKKPMEAAVIQEVIIPPPPPPPPPPPIQPRKIEAAPKQTIEAPPPPFVPPADVAPASTAAPLVIHAAVLPPPAAAPVAPPQPPAVRTDIAVACPTRVKPEVPSRAIKEGVEGTVRAQVVIRDGAVVKVDILSGPPIYRAAVRDAMLRYQCLSGPGEVLATQEFNFKFE